MSNYVAVGSTDITNKVKHPIKTIGGDIKNTTLRVPGSDRFYSFHDGKEVRGWEMDLQAYSPKTGTPEDDLDALMLLINGAAEDTAFYPFTNTRFARIALAGAWEGDLNQQTDAYFGAKAKIWATMACLFGAATTWAPALNALSALITPVGSINAPLDALSVTGVYSGGQLAGLAEEVYQSDGVTLRGSHALATRLLSDEVLTKDYRGKIIQTYTDDFAASTRWTQDAVNDGCSHGSGKITIPNEKSFYYWIKGPWPMAKNLVVSADIAISSGIPLLEYSFDGSTWATAYSGAQLTASRSWIIPNTKGRSDIYIRFKAVSSDFASLTTALTGNNNDLTFIAQKSGVDGNAVTMKYTNAGGTVTLLITVSGNDIDVRLATTSGTITTTSAVLQSALYANVPVMALLRSAAHVAGNDGSGLVTALAKTNLAGATGNASVTVDNLSIVQERKIPQSYLVPLPVAQGSKVKIVGSAGSATISATHRPRYYI